MITMLPWDVESMEVIDHSQDGVAVPSAGESVCDFICPLTWQVFRAATERILLLVMRAQLIFLLLCPGVLGFGSAACTVGYITAEAIANDTFYLGYNSTEFDLCLNNTVLINNLRSITFKVVDPSLQRVILNKLNQLYPSGLPDSVLQNLGSTAQVANITEINKWSITTTVTLSLLLGPGIGWTSEQSKAVIMRYLSVPGKSLGRSEFIAILSYLCSLDVSVLQTISPNSMVFGSAYTVDLSSCSVDQKSVLYSIANSSLRTLFGIPPIYYFFIQHYLGGAPLQDIKVMSTWNINMQINIFMSLNPAVVMNLSVSTVRDLLGVNVPDLKRYENSSMIQAWVAKQKQSDLNTLNIGLLGGIADITDSTLIPSTTPVNITTPESSSATASTSTFTSNNNSNVSASATTTAAVYTMSTTVNITSITTTSTTVTTSDNTTVTKLATVTTNNGSFNTTASSITTMENRTVNTITGVTTTAIINTTGSSSTTITTANVNTTIVNITNGNVNNPSNNITTASHNTTVIPTASISTTTIFASVSTATTNTTPGHIDNTTISATTASHNITVTPTTSVNTTITYASVSTATVNTTTGHVDNTSVSAITASHNTSVTSTASSSTTITTASVNTTTIGITNSNVDNPSNNVTTASHNTTVIPTASISTTTIFASVSTATTNTTPGHIDNTTISATTASHNTTVIPTAGVNTTITFAIVSTATVNTSTGNADNTSVSATTASHNITVTPTTSVNTTITYASVSTATVNTTTGHVDNTSVSATTASHNTSVTSTASSSTTIATASVNTTTIGITNSNVNNPSNNVTTASHNTTVITTAGVNTTITFAIVSTATVNTSTGNADNTTISATTASHNITVTPTTSVNTTITFASVSTATVNTTTGNADNTSVSAITASQNTSVTSTASVNTSTSDKTSLSTTNGALNTTLPGKNMSAPTDAPTRANITTGITTISTNGATAATSATSSPSFSTGASTIITTTTTTIIAPQIICQGVNSYTLENQLSSGSVSAVLCNFNISEYACSSSPKVAALSSDDLVTLLTCKLPSSVVYSKEIWVLFLQKFAAPLPAALDKYSSLTPSISLPDPSFLNAIGDVIVKNFSSAQLRDAVFITQWFQNRLRPFLSSVSADFLSILSSKDFSCETYQVVVNAFSSQEPIMKDQQKLSVISNFIKPFLKGQSCVLPGSNDTDWLVKNFGQFRSSASFSDFISLKSDFNGVNAAEVLTSPQLAELCSDPTRLHGPQDVNTVMAAVSLNQFTSFFDNLTSSIQRNGSLYSSEVKGAFLQAVLVRGGLSSAALPDSEVLQWVNVRLRPLLSSLSSADVTPYFNIIRGRNCNTRQTAVSSLDSLRSSFNSDTQTQIFSNILQLLTGPNGLGCYNGGSFYVFLKNSYLSFGFPDLSAFLSLIPANRQQELLGSISPGELYEFLNGPNTVRNGSDLCTLLNNYNSTNQYLETQPAGSAAVGRQTLGCVWSRALSASSQDEVDQWFNVRLAQYLPFLSSQLISPTQLSSASCLSYRKLVSILGNNYNYSATDFTKAVVYSAIKAYLTSRSGTPRCYNSSDPLLNSTAWFANNIGFFITFISLTDLQSFVSDSQIGVFLENSENIWLFNNSGISSNVTTYYSTQLYIQNSNFNPFRLPDVLLCGAPGSVFVSLGATDSQKILDSIKKSCQQISPEVTAALVANFPPLSTNIVQSLSNQSVSLTEGQIRDATPSVINSTLPVLSVITGWNQGQVNNIIQSITNAGFTINTGTSLVTLGTLVGGVPSATISKISSPELLTVSQNPTFVTNILTAPVILQETYVKKIVSVDQTKVVENVPDALAGYIPPVLLSSPTSVNVTLINKKSWRQEQAVVLFSSVASASDNTEELSESILQGFTCSSVQNLPRSKVTQLIKACRPRVGRNKVVLKESQLTCMYNYVKDDSTLTFTDFPADMLLYYSLGKLTKVNCGSYFRALGGADFSVLSSVLNRQSALFTNAKDCLGISGVSLNRTQVEVLGNMVCTLDSTYIQTSDPLILEKLKDCGELSDSQVTATQTLLFSGNTAYGNPSSWNQQTLDQLGILPLYLNQGFWGKFSSMTVKTFMKSFFPFLKKQKIQNGKLRRLFTAANSFTAKSTRTLTKAACTTGNITEATIADPSFPLGYDSTQFDACLDITFLKDNMAIITEKVVDTSFQTVILNKLNQLFPSGLPDGVVQILKTVSLVASVSDINKWNITTIDTLSSLMHNGDWASDQSKAVIMKYLSVAGNTLGTAEINTIGSNLCSLDPSVLKTITAESLKSANAVNASSCSIDQKSALYSIAKSSFSTQRSDPTVYYQLISSYLGGAPLEDIIALSTLNISVDITTFLNLNPDVIKALNVSTVISLMGQNKADLKLFENTTTVRMWAAQQYNSDLAVLGLSGGKADPVSSTAAPATTVTTLLTNTTITQTNQTVNATTGSGVVHRGSGLWLVSLCAGLLTITLHTL
ncbi:serine-rich adhesin for platelets-like [Colossoma macropomum]|uniref:serine-rich adhesin for platelets-like n=1 Tax=Colossoma macropomum TaxID=42526 RepID=UPI001863C344|nr:serine-rich adhesin for platelets-like [Colossoma macropomum]